MSQRTRYFLVVSGLIVVVGLAVGLVAVYSGGLQGTRSTGLVGLTYVTGEATAVAYADVRHIMDSAFRQRMREVLPAGEGKGRMLAETGIDVERDIDTVLAGLSARILESGGPVVVLSGRFDAARIEEAAVRHGATPADYKGRRLLTVSSESDAGTPSPSPDEPSAVAETQEHPAVAFLEPGLIALGRADSLRRAIDAAEGGESAANNPDLMAFIDSAAEASDAWVAGRLDAVSGRADWPEAMKDHLSSVQWFALSAGIDQTVTCRLRAEARDAKAAEDLRAVVNGALAMARVMASNDARLTALIDSVQSTGTGTEMELSFTVPPEVLDLMASAVPSVARPE